MLYLQIVVDVIHNLYKMVQNVYHVHWDALLVKYLEVKYNVQAHVLTLMLFYSMEYADLAILLANQVNVQEIMILVVNVDIQLHQLMEFVTIKQIV